MTKTLGFLLLLFISFNLSCKRTSPNEAIEAPKKASFTKSTFKADEAILYDKILGALVGSAIGDAMGASTEMWDRKEIQNKYGYILALTPAERIQSPEGTWEHNLSAGATTDDTRWKYLMVSYLSNDKRNIDATTFSKFISDYYQSEVLLLKEPSILTSTDSLDLRMEKIDWIKEWARVALAYQIGPVAYQEAQNRFYGGEMSCAGMLYTPMFGLVTTEPEEAYSLAYKHTLFDLGYAKDISALTAAMTHMGMRTQDMDSILDASVYIDPFKYQDSRLVGRISYQIANSARRYVDLSKNLFIADSVKLRVPRNYKGSKQDWARQELVYDFLEKDARAIPFHAGEIWEILIAGLSFGEGNFEKTMQFIVNYGRDNDTVAAVAGMILGARDGYSKLPDSLKTQVLLINKEQLGINLEEMAQTMVNSMTNTSINNP
ncbi:MAG: ADP-ribosylglycohydrolase family protein [Eudoraea sp.]|uniref:ADP-ribosylglycohydrolase family protein n=1 Tax=Eudoraea sp. TaxID=1979955 RepID=UPI003C737F36